MKKNNKGFFLAETIVMIALVTTVMAFVYPNVAKLYENFKNKTEYYDQTEDIYKLRYVYDYLQAKNKLNALTEENSEYGCKQFKADNTDEQWSEINDDNLKELFPDSKFYITSYMTNLSSEDYEFNKYLKRIKKSTYDSSSYRLIGVFTKTIKDTKTIKNKDDDEITITRYASIKISNPNPDRNCNLGG